MNALNDRFIQPIILKNRALRLEFSPHNGALVCITAPQLNWQILNRSHIALSFRLLVPLSETLRNNPVQGEKQPVTQIEIVDSGKWVRFTWDTVHSERGGTHPITLTSDIKLDAEQAVFSLTIHNRSEYVVEAVDFPYLGDLQPPPGAAWFRTFKWNYASADEKELFPNFTSLIGYFGFDHPVQYQKHSPHAPFILMRSEEMGLYAGLADHRYDLVAWHYELRPGFTSSLESRVPQSATIGNKDVSTRFSAVHMPYVQPGESRALVPIAIQPFRGGWQAGADIYRAWRDNWMQRAEPPEWARQPHSWQQIQINSPEDELRVRYSDLIQFGEECARHGVKAIQLVGWNDGGQDQGNPSHEHDARLGTREELKQAIADIQALGVKVILFVKFTWADRATAWFRDKLIQYAIKDPYGDYYMHGGYQYQTPSQLLNLNTKRLIPMCFLDEAYLDVCVEEFRKVLELVPDGILFDECLHHGSGLACFDTKHGHAYGAPVHANDDELIHRFRQLSEAQDVEFLYVGEACYDWQMQVYHMSYHRSWNGFLTPRHYPLARYLLPEVPLMTALTGFDDRNMVNQCLMYRYIISYEPYNFKGHLDDFPLTLAYGKQMDALRTELREYLWDGIFQDEVGATVTSDRASHFPYTVFVSRLTAKKAVVIANYDFERTIEVAVSLDDGSLPHQYRLVDGTEWCDATSDIRIPPESAVVILPK